MNAREVARKLVELCREGRNRDAVEELYSESVVSVEAATPPGEDRAVEGMDAVLRKNDWWTENHEVHASSVEGPFFHGDDKFAAIFEFDATYKPDDLRTEMHEVAVYTVQNGKVVREEFFYDT
ncbi:MAG: SnoaL-like domain-containing protein [Longimicrobiales bacterium]|nr:SnoaL-like domain-containing protein [Longimicrobiales bacterium]